MSTIRGEAAPAPVRQIAGPDEVSFNADGLVPAVVQEVTTREVLMLAWMDAEALRRTLESGRTWFWSRSRREYWQKGETSGDRQWVQGVHLDCDGDTLLVEVRQDGRGACHTGERSCFHRHLSGVAGRAEPGRSPAAEQSLGADQSQAPGGGAPGS